MLWPHKGRYDGEEYPDTLKIHSRHLCDVGQKGNQGCRKYHDGLQGEKWDVFSVCQCGGSLGTRAAWQIARGNFNIETPPVPLLPPPSASPSPRAHPVHCSAVSAEGSEGLGCHAGRQQPQSKYRSWYDNHRLPTRSKCGKARFPSL